MKCVDRDQLPDECEGCNYALLIDGEFFLYTRKYSTLKCLLENYSDSYDCEAFRIRG